MKFLDHINYKQIGAYLIAVVILVIYILWSINYIIRYKQNGLHGSYLSEINDIINRPNFTQLIEVKNKPDVLNTKLRDLYINTSHNSYISSTQHASYIYPERIYEILQMGFRSIEIDIHYHNNKFYVTHGNITLSTTNKYPLEDALFQIVKFSRTTSDPIILILEIEVPIETRPALSKLIQTSLADKLLDDKYKFKTNKTSYYDANGNYRYYTNRNGIFIDELPLSTFLNKVIVLSGGSPHKLEDILDSSYLYNQSDKTPLRNYVDQSPYADNKTNFLKRVYPSPNITTIYSYNYNPVPWWQEKYNMVSLNVQGTDYYQYLNTLKFKDCSFVPM